MGKFIYIQLEFFLLTVEIIKIIVCLQIVTSYSPFRCLFEALYHCK